MTEPVMQAPAKYRKEPIDIEAMRYQPPSAFDKGAVTNVGAIADWADDGTPGSIIRPTEFWGNEGHPQCWALYIRTLEDGEEGGAQVEHVASPGDWVVRGVEGEFYPVKPTIFAKCYRPVPRRPGTAGSTLTVPDTLAMLHETFCIAQSAIQGRPDDEDRKPEHLARLGRLIDDIDRQRPLGSDGQHGDRHTATCGCGDDR